jgi:dUTP pyrophosphatase
MLELKVKRLHEKAILPVRATEKSGCYDLFALDTKDAMTVESQYIQYRTGIAIEPPDGYDVLIFPRSSISKYPLMLANGVGYADQDYRGELFVRFKHIIKHTVSYPELGYKPGDRIAQIRLIQRDEFVVKEVDELSETERGTGAFGSTGIK